MKSEEKMEQTASTRNSRQKTFSDISTLIVGLFFYSEESLKY